MDTSQLSFLGDESNALGHALPLLKLGRAALLFYRGQAMVTSQHPYWKMKASGHGHTPFLLLAKRADFLLCRGQAMVTSHLYMR